MAQDATIVRFPGNPDEMKPRYAEGLRRFSEAHPTVRPVTMFLGRSNEAPNALLVILLWPNGVDHGVLGGFLLPRLQEIGLERPSVEHISVDLVGFDAITSVRS